MRLTTLVLVLCSCSTALPPESPPESPPADVEPSAPTTADAGTPPANAPPAHADGGIACDANATGDAGPAPNNPLVGAPGPTPSATPASSAWVATGAPGCEGLVPVHVPARLSWSAPGRYCFEGDPQIDGAGNLTFAFDDPSGGFTLERYKHAFFPADGRAGSVVGGLLMLGARPTGFFRSLATDKGQWVFAVDADGTDRGLVRGDADPGCRDFTYSSYTITPDPRGGYVESRVRPEFDPKGLVIRNFELRWADRDLNPRTPWIVGTRWDYAYNMEIQVFVTPSGDVLAMMFFDPPMSMPCPGSMTRALWASEDGAVKVFDPVTPTSEVWSCGSPQFAGFGSGVVLPDSTVAFYHPPAISQAVPSRTGWYVRYERGSGVPAATPAWLDAYDGSLKRLGDGSGYFAVRREGDGCSRTLQLAGTDGQLCATLSLSGADGCGDKDLLSPDGTVALHEWASCSIRWWPRVASDR
jgi:hypothetical protein